MARAGLAWGLAMLLVIPAIDAQTTPGERALLPVTVNEIPRGEVLAIFEGENVLVPRSFAEQVGIALDKATARDVDGESYVSLQSLSPDVTFRFDPNELVLSLTIDPRLLAPQVVELRRGSVSAVDRGGDPTLFLNYAFAGRDMPTASMFAEVGASRDNKFIYTGFSARKGEITRGLTSINRDDPVRMRRLTAGDRVVGSELLGGSAIMGGITVAREFTLRPYLIRSPALDLTGTATTPSTVEVYINGQLANRLQVGPGVFTLRDLPATGGLGTTRLVVRDVFGRETVQDASFYYSTAALRKGLSEYTFSAGMLRENLLESFDYGDPAAYAQYRKGITDTLTLGGRAEASDGILSGGPRVTLATGLGDLDLSAGASRADGTTGTAGSLAYRFTAPRFSFGVSAIRRSDHYATLSMGPDVDRIVQDVNAFAAANFRWLSLGVVGARYDLRDADKFERVAIQGNTPLGRWGNLFASVGRVTQSGRSDPEFLLGITLSLGRDTTGDVQFQRSFGQDGVRAEIRRPLGTGNGFGYALQNDTTFNTRFASLQYQTSFGRYEISADPEKPREATATISGGLVYMGGVLIPTRPLLDSFALARVGVPGVRVFASNQEIGRTNSRGDLLVPNLLGHYVNDLRIDDKDIPMDYQVEGTSVTVVPPTRGGVIAAFPVKRLQSYTGKVRLMIIGEPFTPALGTLVLKSGDGLTLPLGHEGEFYAENLTPGRYPAELRIGVVACNFDLVIPATGAPITDLGVLSCVP